jgi:hypothetical protein
VTSVVFLGTLNKSLLVCKFDTNNASGRGQAGCYNLVPIFDWIRRCIISIFLVFVIAFLPLFLQGKLRVVGKCLLDAIYSLNGFRTRGTWYRKGNLTSGEAVLVRIPDIRGILHTDLLSFHLVQLDFRWSTIYRHW